MPSRSWYLPTSQRVQDGLPSAGWYSPASQSLHDVIDEDFVLELAVPTLHKWQAMLGLLLELAAIQRPGSQSVQVELPPAAAYVPFSHHVHGTVRFVSELEDPGAHSSHFEAPS